MNIKDELDVMLANLQQGGSNGNQINKKPTEPKPVLNEIKPSRFGNAVDDMSVDDILNAVSKTRKPTNAAPSQPKAVKIEKSPTAPIRSAENEIPAELLSMLGTKEKKETAPITRTVEKKDAPYAEPQMELKATPVTKTEKTDFDFTSLINEATSADKVEVNNSAPIEEAPVDNSNEIPVHKPKKPKHRKIVIKHELPDYEKLRQTEETKPIEEAPEEIDSDEILDSTENSDIAALTEDISVEDYSSETQLNDVEDTSTDISEQIDDEPLFEEEEDFANEALTEETVDNEQDDQPKKNSLFSKLKDVFKKKNDDIEIANEKEVLVSETPDDLNDTVEEYSDFLDESSDVEVSSDIESENDEMTSEPETPAYNEIIDDFDDEISETDNAEDNVNSNISELENEIETDDLFTSEISSTEYIANEAVAAIDEIENDTLNTEEPIKEADKASSKEEEYSPVSNEDEINIDIAENTIRKKSRIVSTLENILDEVPAEIVEGKSEPNEDDEINVTIKNKKGFKKHLYTVLGVVFFIFAIVGFTFSVGQGIRYVRSFTAGDNKKDEFIDTVYPMVIMDIEAFKTPSELSSEQIITASIWSLIMSDDMDKYVKTLDITTVPAVDIEKYAANLFGDGLPTLEHQTVGSGDEKFYYNEETKSYNIRTTSTVFSYQPNISAISKNGNIYTIEVEYIKEIPAWMEKSSKFNNEISKVAKYKLQKTDDGYIVNSVEVIKINEVA